MGSIPTFDGPMSTVSVHALSGGHLTLPERFFVSPLADQTARKTVPSLSFLIVHTTPTKVTRLVFDLGLRRDPSAYSPEIYAHSQTRLPLLTKLDVAASLAEGGLSTDDIDYCLLSHAHWDHIGTPTDFSSSTFIVGNGTLGLLSGSTKLENGSHSHFEADLLPQDRTIELTDPNTIASRGKQRKASLQDMNRTQSSGSPDFSSNSWEPFAGLPATLDIFSDGSLLIVDAPGHLPGHINLLCRVSSQPDRYIYLAGDSCHDRRILSQEKSIAEWTEPDRPHNICCIHGDKKKAEETIERIRSLEAGLERDVGKVEVVFAHDVDWERKAKAEHRFWPGHL